MSDTTIVRTCQIDGCSEFRHPPNMYALLEGSKVVYFCSVEHVRQYKALRLNATRKLARQLVKESA